MGEQVRTVSLSEDQNNLLLQNKRLFLSVFFDLPYTHTPASEENGFFILLKQFSDCTK